LPRNRGPVVANIRHIAHPGSGGRGIAKGVGCRGLAVVRLGVGFSQKIKKLPCGALVRACAMLDGCLKYGQFGAV
jgi:hypothetical protein